MKTTRVISKAALITVALTAIGIGLPTRPVSAEPIQIADVKVDGEIDFESKILPILQAKCIHCHNRTKAESDLILETPQTIQKGGEGGAAVVVGKGAESMLLKVASHQEEPIMPPEDNPRGAKPLTPEELGLLKLWIDQGAKGQVTGLSGAPKWQPLPAGVNPVYAVAISADGQYVAAGRANQIFVYHVPSKREIGRLTDPDLLKAEIYNRPGVAHWDLVQALAFSPDNNTLASAGYRTVKIWQRPINAKLAELAGLESAPHSMAVAQDGKLAAIGEESGKIRIFDLATGQVAKTLEGHSAAVSGVSFSADGAQLASGSQDKTFRLWNVADGKQIGEPVATPAPVNAVALVNEDKNIATGGADNVIRIWTLPGAAPAEAEEKKAEEENADAAPKPVKEIPGHSGPVNSLAVVPGGKQLLSGSQDGTVRVWDVNGGKQVRSISHGGPVTSVAVRPDGQRFASASSNNTAKLWNAANGQPVAELKGNFRKRIDVDDLNRAVALAKRKVGLAKTDLDNANKRKTSEEANLKKAEEALKKAQEEFKKKEEAAKKPVADKEAADKKLAEAKAALAKAEETKKAAEEAFKQADEALKKAQEALKSAADDKKADAEKAVKDAEAKRKETEDAKKKADQEFTTAQNKSKQEEANVKKLAVPAQKATDEKNAAQRAMQASQRSVERGKQSVQKATAAVPTFDAAMKAEEAKQKEFEGKVGEAAKSVTESEKPLFAVAFSPDGKTVASAGEGQILYTWDSETGAAIDTFEGQAAVIRLLGFRADGNVISAAQNNSVVVWDTKPEWKLKRTIGSPDSADTLVDRVTALDFNSDGKWLATGSGEPSRSGQLKIWNVEDGKLIKEIPEPHSDTIFGLEFSPDDQHIATCGADRFMKVFSVADGKFVKSFEGHTHHVLGVSWSADGRTLASSGADKVVKVWNFVTGDQTRTIAGFGKEVTSIQFVGDALNFVVSCGDRNVTMKRADNGGNIRGFGGSTDFVFCVRSSGDGKKIVAGGQDSVVRIWADNGQALATFNPPEPEPTESAGGG